MEIVASDTDEYVLIVRDVHVQMPAYDGQLTDDIVRHTLPCDDCIIINKTALIEHGYDILNSEHPEAIHHPIELDEVFMQAFQNSEHEPSLPGNDIPPDLTKLIDDLRTFRRNFDRLGDYFTITPMIDFYTIQPTGDQVLTLVKQLPKTMSVLDIMQVIHIDIPGIIEHVLHQEPPANRHRVFMAGGQHAREWLSQKCLFIFIRELVMQIQNSLLTNEPLVFAHQMVFDLIPIVNILGHHKSIKQIPRGLIIGGKFGNHMGHFNNRMQRKPGLLKADLNRNWKSLWGDETEKGCSHEPIKQDYCGEFAESAIEVRAIEQFLTKSPEKYVFGMDWHSYSGVWLRFPSFSLDKLAHDAIRQTYDPESLTSDHWCLLSMRTDLDMRTRELAFMKWWHSSNRAQLQDQVFQGLHHHAPTYPANGEKLKYKAVGVLSDRLYAGHGMLGCGVEIGQKYSNFASDSAGGFRELAEFGGEMLKFFTDRRTCDLFTQWKLLTTNYQAPHLDAMEMWQAPIAKQFSGGGMTR